MSGKAGRGSDQFVVRLPDGMRERIKRSAEASGRSMNAEIVSVLEAAFPPSLTRAETYQYLREWLRDLPDHDKEEVLNHLKDFAERGFEGE